MGLTKGGGASTLCAQSAHLERVSDKLHGVGSRGPPYRIVIHCVELCQFLCKTMKPKLISYCIIQINESVGKDILEIMLPRNPV